jgi:hypothetical protein
MQPFGNSGKRKRVRKERERERMGSRYYYYDGGGGILKPTYALCSVHNKNV